MMIRLRRGRALIGFNVRDEWLTTQDIDDVGREAHGNSIEDVCVHLHDINTEGLEPTRFEIRVATGLELHQVPASGAGRNIVGRADRRRGSGLERDAWCGDRRDGEQQRTNRVRHTRSAIHPMLFTQAADFRSGRHMFNAVTEMGRRRPFR